MKFFSRVILPVLLCIYIAIETYAKLHHTSICGTEGCELAGELLKFNSIYLNYFGGVGALFIAIFGWFSLRNSAVEKLFYVTLYAAIAFESIMISYQIIANPEPCIFCLGVYGALLVTALLSHGRYLFYALPAIAALFVSMNMLDMTQNRAIIPVEGTYLIHSETCPHCKKVRTYFHEHHIAYTGIPVQDTNARFFIKQLGIHSIPVLVIQKGNLSKVIKGDKAIIAYFANKATNRTSGANQSSSADALIQGGGDAGGCSLDNQIGTNPGEESSCEQDAAVPLR